MAIKAYFQVIDWKALQFPTTHREHHHIRLQLQGHARYLKPCPHHAALASSGENEPKTCRSEAPTIDLGRSREFKAGKTPLTPHRRSRCRQRAWLELKRPHFRL